MQEQKKMEKEDRENKEKKGSGESAKVSFDFKKYLPFVFVLVLIILIIAVYFMFFRPTSDVKETALDLRNTVLDLSLSDEQSLEDYHSMLMGRDIMKYNSCSPDNVEILNRDFSWTRDWFYLMIFDSLYPEVTGAREDDGESEVLLNAMYEEYATEEGFLSLAIPGWENSYCLPYFVLDKLEREAIRPSYEESYNLAKRLCYDFYDLNNDSYCAGEDTCVNEEEFYSKLEDIFLIDEPRELPAEDDYSRYDDYNDKLFYSSNRFVDDYIIAYENNLENFVYFLNARLFDAIDYMEFDVNFMNRMESVGPCYDNTALYLHLLRSMSIKKNYLSNANLIERHENIEYELMQLCGMRYSNLNELFLDIEPLGDKIEFYYIFESILDKDLLDKSINQALRNDLFSKDYENREYLFLESRIPDDSEDCFDIEVNLRDNLKSSLYMLIYSAYED